MLIKKITVTNESSSAAQSLVKTELAKNTTTSKIVTLAGQRTLLDSPDSVLPEETKLFLPSELRAADRALPRACAVGLVDGECRLREAECRDALESLRQGLRTRSAGHLFTVRNVTGQNPTTRAEGVQRKVQVAIYLSKLRYRWARNALFQLRGHGTWERELRVLNDADVRGMNERLLTAEELAERQALSEQGIIDEVIAGPSTADAVVSRGEGRRQLSWIWYSYAEPVDALSVATRNDNPVIHEGEFILNVWCLNYNKSPTSLEN